MLALALAMPSTPARASGATQSSSATPLNIVYILTDDQTYESLSVMPYVTSRTDWISFTNAFVNVSLCCPSRATILSGQYSVHTGVEHNRAGDLFNSSDTVATWLHGVGYHTGLIGKYLNNYPWGGGDQVPAGWDDWRVFTDDDEVGHEVGYYGYTLNENGVRVSYGSSPSDYATDVEAQQAVNFIGGSSEPFFLTVAPKAPHAPWTPPDRYKTTTFGVEHHPNFNEGNVTDKPTWVRALGTLDEAVQDRERLDANRTLLGVDDLVASVFAALEDRGVLDRTVVVFMTDNGYAFGEHRWSDKRCPYDECLHTPLLVRYPGLPGRVVDALVDNVDIAPTFTEIAGAVPTIPQDGTSLLPLVTGDVPSVHNEVLFHWVGGNSRGADAAHGSIPGYWGIRDSRYMYLEYETGEVEMYNLKADPWELRNRGNDPAYAAIQADLAVRLHALVDPLVGPRCKCR